MVNKLISYKLLAPLLTTLSVKLDTVLSPYIYIVDGCLHIDFHVGLEINKTLCNTKNLNFNLILTKKKQQNVCRRMIDIYVDTILDITS